jgi:flap endonuclease-1
VTILALSKERKYYNILGIGPVKAFKLIKEHKNIKNIIKYLDSKNKDNSIKLNKEEFLYKEARELLKNPDVIEIEEVYYLVIKF